MIKARERQRKEKDETKDVKLKRAKLYKGREVNVDYEHLDLSRKNINLWKVKKKKTINIVMFKNRFVK